MNIIIPSIADVNKDVFIPFNRKRGQFYLNQIIKFNALLIQMNVANNPSKAHKIPSNTILLVLNGSFIFL